MEHIEFQYDIDPKGLGFFWPASEQKRRDFYAVKLLTPAVAESVYQCRPGAREGSIFVEADFRYYKAPRGLDLGLASPAVKAFVESSSGIVVQGWDTALTASSSSDWSVCVTALLVLAQQYYRNEPADVLGPCETHYDVYVLDVYREKLEIGDTIAAIRRQHQKWQPHQIVIEKRANGVPAMQALASSSIPMEGVNPTESKRDRAINGGAGAGSVQGWFRAGRVLFPTYDSVIEDQVFLPWLPVFIRELKDFTGEKGGRDDQVDALVHLVNWAIGEGGNAVAFPTGWQTPEAADHQMMGGAVTAFAAAVGASMMGHNGGPSIDDVFDVAQMLSGESAVNPFLGTCGVCVNFKNNLCLVHKRQVSAIYPACDHYDDGQNVSFLSGRF